MFEIRYYESSRGEVYVREYIDQLVGNHQCKILAFIKKLRNQGYLLRRPVAAYLGSKLWELRPGSHRILYSFYERDKIILLHAFHKKSSEVPKGDMELAMNRLNDWLNRGRYEK